MVNVSRIFFLTKKKFITHLKKIKRVLLYRGSEAVEGKKKLIFRYNLLYSS